MNPTLLLFSTLFIRSSSHTICWSHEFRTFLGFLVVVFTSFGVDERAVKLWSNISCKGIFADYSSTMSSCLKLEFERSSEKESLSMVSLSVVAQLHLCDIWRAKCRLWNDLWIKRINSCSSHLQVSLLYSIPFWEGTQVYHELFASGDVFSSNL